MKVKVYRNLNRKGFIYSVKSPRTGLVIDRTDTLFLKKCEMKVSQKGRNRVLKEKRKNVHAYIVGERLKRKPSLKNYFGCEIKYNPYLAGHFFLYEKDKNPSQERLAIRRANYVTIKNGVVKAWFRRLRFEF